MDVYEGTVESIVFRNGDNGYTVLEMDVGGGDEIIVVGNFAQVFEGERLRVSGEWTQHREYGDQLKLESYTHLEPLTQGGVERMLCGGLIKGIGPATAKAIARRFGKDALVVLENDPARLTEIRGISRAKALGFSSQYKAQRGAAGVLEALGTAGLSPKEALKLYTLYGENALETLKENPYRIIDEVEGFGFVTADKIALGLGFDEESSLRLAAGLKHVLYLALGDGHTYLPREALERGASKLLGALEGPVSHALDKLIIAREVLLKDIGCEAVFLPFMYEREADSANLLIALQSEPPPKPPIDAPYELSRLEVSEKIKLAPMQREAVLLSLKSGVTIITGGPGTGKTTILSLIIRLMHKIGLDVALAAPTGRAAKRMTETTGFKASTLHRLLEYGRDTEGGEFGRNAENPLALDVLLVDEASMIDVPLLHGMLDALPPGTRVIFCGDKDQLPSVGPGNVLHDMIESALFPVVRLNEVFRQSETSMIVRNAHRINSGEEPELAPGGDFTFEPYEDQDLALKRLISLAAAAKRKGYDVIREVQALAPMKRGLLGVWNCNAQLQYALNPPSPGKPDRIVAGKTFRLGDKVMHTSNDYQQQWTRETDDGIEQGAGVFNGDMGQITAVGEDGLSVLFDDDRLALYSLDQAEGLELAYCVSIHKSQGSEFKIVLLPLCECPYPLSTRNLLYTAVTRAQRSVVIMGRWSTLMRMVQRADTRKRYSALKWMLNEFSGAF